MPRPNGRDPETDPRAFLGTRLRRGRVAAGFSSQEALAGKLGFDRSVVSKAETGERPPTDDVLAAWCEVCQLDEELFTGLVKLARSSDGPVPPWFADWIDEVEPKAHTLRIWQPVIIPGLLQTAEYARALFLATGVDEDRAEDLVTARMGRQAILDRGEPPTLWAVLDEAVLRRRVGSEEIMYGSLTRLAELAKRPHIAMQIVPAVSGANAGCVGALTIASVDGTPDALLTEAVEDVTSESRSLLRKAFAIFDRVRYEALPRAASLELLMEVAEQWKR